MIEILLEHLILDNGSTETFSYLKDWRDSSPKINENAESFTHPHVFSNLYPGGPTVKK